MLTVHIANKPPWLPYNPCPCGSNKPFGICCMGYDSYPRIAVPSLVPPPPRTGYANCKCYLSATNDCSQKISREHYISDTVLQAIPGPLFVSGASWQPQGGSQEMRRNNLTAKILCERHNNSLSPLDTAAGRLFEAVRAIYHDFRVGARSPVTSWTLCSGELLELWSLKVVFGMHRGRIAKSNRGSIRDTHSLDFTKCIQALSAQCLEHPCGMYMSIPEDKQTQNVNFGIKVEPIGTPDRIGGVRIGIQGLDFDFIFDPSAVYQEAVERRVYRPRYLTFRNALQCHTVMLTWPRSGRVLEPELAVKCPD
jgi:hypothetical protein